VNADRSAVLNLVAPPSVKSQANEFNLMVADLMTVKGLTRDNFALAQENNDNQDISLMHQSTSWDARLIATAATATSASAAARDVIPNELRRAGAVIDVVEAYETVVPKSSRTRLRAALKDARKRPNVVTFTSSSTVKNFVQLLGASSRGRKRPAPLGGVTLASIGPVTSATLRDLGLGVDVQARQFTIPGLVAAIVASRECSPI
jgi:hypothetical protein